MGLEHAKNQLELFGSCAEMLTNMLDVQHEALLLVDHDGLIVVKNQAATSIINASLSNQDITSVYELVTDENHEKISKRLKNFDLQSKQSSCNVSFNSISDAQAVTAALTFTSVFNKENTLIHLVKVQTSSDEQANVSAIERSEAIRSAILDASLDTLITIDMEGDIVEFSASGESTLGWSREQVIGNSLVDLIIPMEMRDAHIQGMKKYKDTGTGPLLGKRVEVNALHKEGHLIPIELALVSMEFGSERYVTAFIRDISERKQAEQALIDAKEKAESASLAKSRFLSFMSHEIRSPLNALLGSLQLLGDSLHDKAEKKYFHIAQVSGDNLLSIINEILDFSKIEAGHIQVHQTKCNLESLLNTILVVSEQKKDNDQVRLFGRINTNLPKIVMLDEIKLRQVITILVDNALKFTDKGMVQCAIEQGESSGELKVTVEDTGVGISPDKQAKVFAEFEQVDAVRDTSYGGTGLGLAIAKKLVEVMGGSIGLKSSLNEGTVFEVVLPYYTDDANSFESELNSGHGEFLVFSKQQEFHEQMKRLLCQDERTRMTFASTTDELDVQFQSEQYYALLLDGASVDQDIRELQQHFPSHTLVVGKYDEPFMSSVKQVEEPLTNIGMYRLLDERSDHHADTDKSKLDLNHALRVLLVDDVEINRVVGRKLLENKGFTVDDSADGFSAIKALEVEYYDCVLMDMRMPELSGLDAIEIIRKSSTVNHDVPIIALTANAETSEVERCKAVGADEFVSKPFNIDFLTEVIQNLQSKTIRSSLLETKSKG